MGATWDRRSREEHERVRRTVLSRWLPTVARFSPFWRAHLDEAGIDPAEVLSTDDLARIPPVEADDVRGAGGAGSPALVLRPREDDLKAVASLSLLWRLARSVVQTGPIGKRRTILVDYKPIHLHRAEGGLSIAYSRRDLDRLHRCGARAAAVLGLGPADYLVSAVPYADHLDFWGVHHLALGTSLLALHPRGSRGFEGVAEAFAHIPATAVAVPTEEALRSAGEVEGEELARVRTVVLVGAPPSDDLRGGVAEAWRAAGAGSDLRVVTLWGPPEARAPWAECAEGGAETGFHTYPDLDVVEVTDGGELTYTSLGWNGTALLRYRTGTRVGGLETVPCRACGRTTPRIVGPVEGR